MSSSVDIDNKRRDILILGKGPTQGLDTTITTEAIYPINFTQSRKRFAVILHCNGNNSFLFVKATKLYQCKAKDFTINNMKKTGLKRVVNFFFCWF